jgi:hypothetical protein
MLDNLKRALVESYVGAIALGYLLAQSILNFVGVFASPVMGWVMRNQYRGVMPNTSFLSHSSLDYAVPDLVRFLLLIVACYVLLRWLYFKPFKREADEPAPSLEQAD